MKKLRALLPLALALGLVGAAPAAADNHGGRAEDTSGGIQMTVHTHSSGTLLFAADRLSYEATEGEPFSYSSRPCSGSAAFNDLGLDFNPDVAGVDDDGDGTAPVRHHVEGTVTGSTGNTGTVEGTITSVLCETVNGIQVESDSAIVSHFEGRFTRVGDNDLMVIGTFTLSPTESTGVFAGIEGQGSLRGWFTCLAHQRDATAPSCEEIGEFTDFTGIRGDRDKGAGELAPGLVGSYTLPTGG